MRLEGKEEEVRVEEDGQAGEREKLLEKKNGKTEGRKTKGSDRDESEEVKVMRNSKRFCWPVQPGSPYLYIS